MPKQIIPRPETLVKTIAACVANAGRLIEESYDLEFRSPSSSRFYLLLIAQEELAKAFILSLVKEGVLPFTNDILRVLKDHACKQLVGMVMDYVIMHWDDLDQLEAMVAEDVSLGYRLPNGAGSAMELLRYEKIDGWRSKGWGWTEDPAYDPVALAVADGEQDRRKQDALYVRVAPDGQVSSTPASIANEETANALARAERYTQLVRSMIDGRPGSLRYDKTVAALRLLFGDQMPTLDAPIQPE